MREATVPTTKTFLSGIHLDALYQRSQGDPQITVAIIDGVVDGTHDDFKDTAITMLGSDDNAATCVAKDHPSCQHGTFVTGILAANRQSSAPGICPHCTFVVEPLFCEAASLSQCPVVSEPVLAQAVRNCVAAGANIINMSVGVSTQQDTLSADLSQAYDQAEAAGVLLVGASGNQASDSVNSIFRHPWVIAVAAMDPDGQIVPTSNRGPWVVEHGLLAPGSQIVSSAAGGGYQQMSGTSVAAPFVTGVAALLWSQQPQASAQTIRSALLQRLENSDDGDNSSTAQQLLKPRLKLLNGALSLTLLQQSWQHHNKENAPMTSAPVTKEAIAEEKAETIIPQGCSCGGLGGSCSCGSYANNSENFVYAVGELQPVFPNKGLQQTFLAAAKALNLSEYDYYQVFNYQNSNTLQQPHRNIAEQVCWVLKINHVDTYIVIPRTTNELDQFINALAPNTDTLQVTLSCVIGILGPQSPPNFCQDLSLPMVLCDQLYSFTMDQLHQLLSQHAGTDAIQDVIKQLEFEPNSGATDSNRAKNYLAFRYPAIYEKTASLKTANQQTTGLQSTGAFSLADIQTNYSDTTSDRLIIDVILNYQSNSHYQKICCYCSVDVTGAFPFINSPLTTFIPVQ